MNIDEMRKVVAARKQVRDGTAKALRIKAGISQALLASVLNVDVSTISKWESGQRNPEPGNLLRWLDALNALESATSDEVTATTQAA